MDNKNEEISHLEQQCRFWGSVLKIPGCFLAVNVVLLVLFTRASPYHVWTASLIYSVCMLVNFASIVKAIRHLEREEAKAAPKEQSEDAPSEDEEEITGELKTSPLLNSDGKDYKGPYNQASHSIDSFLSRGRGHPKVTMFLQLLYIAAILSISLSFGWFGGTLVATDQCNYKSIKTQDEAKVLDLRGNQGWNITSDEIPSGLHSWVRDCLQGTASRTFPTYLHMADRTTYFGGTSKGYRDILVVQDAEGNLQEYRDIVQPEFVPVSGGDDIQTACFVYNWGSHVACMDAFADTPYFRNTTLAHRAQDGRYITGFDGYVWFFRRSYPRGLDSWISELIRVNSTTMEITKIDLTSPGDLEDRPFEADCIQFLGKTSYVLSSIMMFVGSVGAWKTKKISSSLVTLVLSPVYLLPWDVVVVYGFVFWFLAIGLMFGLISREEWMIRHKDDVLWVMYGGLMMPIMAGGDDPSMFLLATLSMGVLGIALDHPVLSVAGMFVGVVGLGCLLISPFGIVDRILPIGGFLLLLSLALLGLEQLVQKYRFHGVYYWNYLIRATTSRHGHA